MSLFDRLVEQVLGREIPIPDDVPPDLVPDGVKLREGRIVPMLGGWLSRLNGPAAAVALRRTIVVRPGVPLTRRLLEHELAHIRQWTEDPLFPVRYSLETLRHGYAENRYEREARDAEVAARDDHTSKERRT